MSKLWEVDPDTRAKLQDVQKQPGNNACIDCGAPGPQWASPKFGILMCLNCSGIHRGFGVHISFVRSVSMDAFKVAEVKRMQLGGNKVYKSFFDKHEENTVEGKTFESCSIRERYDCAVGEEYKERLTAKVEGRDYVSGERPRTTVGESASGRGTPVGMGGTGPSASRGQSPAPRSLQGGLGAPPSSAGGRPSKAQNEAYFAKMGEANASRPDDLPPSQGGKFAGFGSAPVGGSDKVNDDWIGDFQKDPMAGLTKGFGWLGKSAKTGYEGWVRPNVQKLAESDLAAQARQGATQFGTQMQSGARTAGESFNRFVEGGDEDHRPPNRRASVQPDADKRGFWDNFGEPPKGPDPEKKDFWESFGESPKGPDTDKKDFWDSFGAAPKGPPKEKQGFWDEFAEVGHKRAESNSGAGGLGFGGVGGASGSGGVNRSNSSVGTSAMRKKNEDSWGDW